METPEPQALANRLFVLVAGGCIGFFVATLLVTGF